MRVAHGVSAVQDARLMPVTIYGIRRIVMPSVMTGALHLVGATQAQLLSAIVER